MNVDKKPRTREERERKIKEYAKLRAHLKELEKEAFESFEAFLNDPIFEVK